MLKQLIPSIVLKMKQKISLLILLFTVLIQLSFTHPLKLTASLVEYNPDKKTIRMECRVFMDDFKKSIHSLILDDIDITNPTEEDKKRIEVYFNKYYKISINEKKIPLVYKDFEIKEKYNVITYKFLDQDIDIKKGDKLLIENTLLFKDFGYVQSNIIAMQFPPFFLENSYETTMTNISYSYTF